jgi:hypothetical protein
MGVRALLPKLQLLPLCHTQCVTCEGSTSKHSKALFMIKETKHIIEKVILFIYLHISSLKCLGPELFQVLEYYIMRYLGDRMQV